MLSNVRFHNCNSLNFPYIFKKIISCLTKGYYPRKQALHVTITLKICVFRQAKQMHNLYFAWLTVKTRTMDLISGAENLQILLILE